MHRISPEVMEELQELHPYKVQIARFLESEGFNMYRHTSVKYFPLGEEMLDAMIEDLKKAKKCIFLDYFIISDGVIWQRVKEVLLEKAKEGIDIRLLIDDFGCLGINTAEFRNELGKSGIRLAVFAPIHKNVDRLSFNYRNHQKITIVDGNIGYCGGINLADEYANIINRFGHWKDTAFRLEGEGVWGLTSIFLEMWEVTMGYEITTDYSVYMPTVKMPNDGLYSHFVMARPIIPIIRRRMCIHILSIKHGIMCILRRRILFRNGRWWRICAVQPAVVWM